MSQITTTPPPPPPPTAETNGTNESGYSAAYDAAKEGAQENTEDLQSGDVPADAPDEIPPGDDVEDGLAAMEENDHSPDEISNQDTTDKDTSYEDAKAQVRDEMAGADDTRREQMLQALRQQLQQAKGDGNKALQQGNAQLMEQAFQEIGTIVDSAQEQVEQAREGKAEDKKEAVKQFKDLRDFALLDLKNLQNRIVKTKWNMSTLSEAMQKAAVKSDKDLKRYLNGRALEKRSQAATKDTEANFEAGRQKYTEFQKKFGTRAQIGQDANALAGQSEEAGAEKLTPEQKAQVESETPEIAHEGFHEALSDAKLVKHHARKAEKRDFDKSKDGERVGSVEGSEDAEVAEEIVRETVNGPKSKEDFEQTVALILASDKMKALTPEEKSRIRDELLNKYAARQAGRLEAGAQLMTCAEEEVSGLVFGEARAIALGEDLPEGKAGSKEKQSFRGLTLSAAKALSDGNFHKVAKALRKELVTASQTVFDGQTEDGILNFNRLTTAPGESKTLTTTLAEQATLDDLSKKHRARRQQVLDEAMNKGQVFASTLQQPDEDTRVG